MSGPSLLMWVVVGFIVALTANFSRPEPAKRDGQAGSYLGREVKANQLPPSVVATLNSRTAVGRF